MNQRILRALGVMLAVGSASCGGNANRTQLSDEQKETLRQTITSVGRTQSAATVASKFATSSPGASLAGLAAVARLTRPATFLGEARANVLGSVAGSTPSGSDDRTQRMREQMDRRLSDQTCTAVAQNTDLNIDRSSIATRLSAQMPAANLSIGGAQCPMTMKMSFSAAMTSARSATIDMSWQYAVQDEDFRRLNDVDGISLGGTLKMQGDDGNRLAMDIGIQGDIHSQGRGPIHVTVSGRVVGDDHQGDGHIDLSFAYPDFTATLGVDFDGKKQHYFIGSDEVSADQFQAFFANHLSASDPSTPGGSRI